MPKKMTPTPEIHKGYKGFNKDLACRDKQYEIGKTYEEDKAKLCNLGMHYCEYPLDCFNYYAPGDSRYCEVEAENPDAETGDDSKHVTKKLTIGAEINFMGLVKAAVAFVLEKIDKTKEQQVMEGYQSAATNTGDRSAATNTGDRSAATNTGDRSAATNTGYQSAATNTGDRSAATNTGNRSAAKVEGKESVAVAMGYESKAAASLGSWIVLTEWDETEDGYRIKDVRSARIDGEILKANTYYTLQDGEFVEVED